MLKTTLAGLRAHLVRLVLTALAITLGVGFVSGTFVLTDTMKAGFDQQFTASANKVSVAVRGKDTGSEQGVPVALLTRTKGLPGVQDAQGLVRGTAPLIGKDGKVYGDSSTLGLSISTGALQRYQLKAGRLPTTAGMVVLDTKTAQRSGFKVGDTVKVLDHQDRQRSFTVSGLMDFGVDQEIAYRGAVGFTAAAATEMTGERGFTEIDVKAAPGTADGRLRDEVASAAGDSYDVFTSHQLAKRLSASSGVSADQIAVFFLAFAIVALFVSALVIYNTFNILVAQRTREMALLRCVGASKAQIFRGVLTESLIVGFVASAAGVLVGIGLGNGGAALFASIDNSPAGPVTVSPTPIVAGMLAGMVITVVSALLPARAATRVSPIAALRSQLEGPVTGRASRFRTIIGGLTGLAGLALIGLALIEPAGQGPFLLVLGGAILTFLGVVALSPIIVRRLSRVVGWLPARYMGVPGRLAGENAGRNPKRAAVTTIALTVGVTLMTMFSVALVSMQATADSKLNTQFPVDYQLTTGSDRPIPRQAAADLRTKPQLADVIEERTADGRLSGHKLDIGAVTDGSLGRTVKPKLVAGSITDLRPGTVALAKRQAMSLGVGVGRGLSLSAGGQAIPLKVAAIFSDEAPIPSVVITEEDFAHTFGAKDDTSVAIMAKKGVSADESRRVVEEATKAYPMVKVSSLADIKAEFTKALNQMFLLVGALLGLAIIISLIGIANTLTLSVVERTRESALLRALGLTRRGLRWMLSLEAVIMAVIGALLGVVLGTGFGWAALGSIFDGAVLGFPVLRVLTFVVVAGLAGLLAAVIPGRRAAKASIVESLASE
ncbi:ABC transporter permease [Actinoallomurus bryophytorum]|uniref:Putative ABC transport system permease protein n=1 Tax=Actinoallomurus bryophytorum TaxID=1490222 RepID=A0A543CIN8_9ACTN|nr:FtsX-like permease family protein [Actinoallomurus bryophytorum]TQL96900.1 putative ABC transport system permease protein [Actinoallomurus bryophytorum]